LKVRLSEHLDPAQEYSAKSLRINRIIESGFIPDIVLLQDDISSEKSAFTREVYWIETFYQSGSPLTNASIDYRGVFFLADYSLLSINRDLTISDEEENEVEDDYESNAKQAKVWHVQLDNLSDSKSPKDADMCEYLIKAFEEDEFFHVEKCKTRTPINWPTGKVTKQLLSKMRSANSIKGRLLNHGTPITKEEIAAIKFLHNRGKTLKQLETYFQRKESTIVRWLTEET
jgi:hypothetical protein